MRTLKLMICYAGKDKATALAIAKELNGKVFPDLDVTIEVICMDDRDKGCINEWDKWSMNTVHESDIIMQLWTPSLLQYTEEGEPYCDKVLLEELGNARELGKQIIILDALGKNKYTRSMESFSRITKDPFPYFNDISQNEIAGIVTAVHRRAYEICHKQQPDYRVPPTTIGSLDSMGTLGDRFVGRKLDLDKIEEIFRAGKKVVILHGDGGIGKTELMRKYVYDHKTEDYYCYKVCGDSHDLSLARELLSLQYKQELTDAQKRLGEYEQFCIRLETLKQLDPRFFLVIDNFNANFDTPENKRVLNKLIESIPFKLIISSRNDSRNAAVGTWHVGSLTPEEQKVLFYNESDLPRTAENDRKIEEISERIDGHTMTLELCARLVKKRGYPLEKIIQELLHVSGKVECEHTGEKKEIGEHLIRLFELAELSEGQKSLLYALSFFCRLGVSYADLEEVADQGDIEDDLDDLVEMSLVKQQKDGNYYLHPLVATLANDVYREGREELRSRVGGFIFSEYDVDPQNDSQSKLLVKRSYLSHLLPLTPVDAMLEDRVIILQTLGKLAELLDDDPEAINYYRQGLALAEKGQKESNEEDIRSRYCSLCRDLAELLWVRGETIEANELLLQQLQVQKKLAEDFDTPENKRMLSTVLDNLADLYETQEDYLRAKEMHENSLDVKKQLMEELDTIESKDDFSAACDSLGFFCDCYDVDLEKAKYYYRQGIEISKELMKLLAAVIMGESIPMPKLKPWEPCFLGVPDEEEATRRYLDNYNRVKNMSTALAHLEDFQEEPEAFSDEAFSEELFERNYLMTKRPLTLSPTPENKSAHITACKMLANHLQNKGDYERAKEIYQYAFTISKRLMREMDTPMSKYAFAELCLRLGVFFHETGADAEAKDVLQQGYSMMKDFLKDKKSSRFDVFFIEYCERLCEFFKDMKASEKEEATYMDAFETMKKHVGKSDNIQSKNAFADLCLCIFYFFKEKDDLIRSEKYCRMYYDIKKQLMEQLGTPKSQRDFASACEILGAFLDEKGDVVQPIELYRRSLGARKNILGTSLRPDETFYYTMVCRSIAAILGEDGAPEMKAHYDYGYTTAKKNMEKKKSLISKQEFRMVASSYAFFLSKTGEHVEAEKIAEECYLQTKELAEGSNDRRNTMNLIEDCYLFAGELAENGNTQKAGEIYLVCLKAMMRLLDTPLDDDETFIIRTVLGIAADFYNDIGESRYDYLALIVGITYTLDKKFDNLVDLIKNLFALTSPAEVEAKIAELLKRYEELKADPNY